MCGQETLEVYTTELTSMLTLLKQHAKRVIWVSTTPVPLSVTEGPERHNADVLAFNSAAARVTSQLQIPTADVYSAVMQVCPASTGPPDYTYEQCSIQHPGGVHFWHYDVLVAAIYQAVTGRPAAAVAPSPPGQPVAPPPPSPSSCAEEAAASGCANQKGNGAACEHCFVGSRTAHIWNGPGSACLDRYVLPNLR